MDPARAPHPPTHSDARRTPDANGSSRASARDGMERWRRCCGLATAVALLALVAAGCGSGDDPSGDDTPNSARDAATTTEPENEADVDDPDTGETAEPTRVPDPVAAGEMPPIVVTAPESLGYVSGSFFLTGSAMVTEGDLRWAILDAQLKPMASGAFSASCGGPCRGSFRTRVPLDDVAVGSWELHVWAPPVDEGDPPRVHDTMVPITVTEKPVEGTPAPGAEPPGGVPMPAAPAGGG